MFEFKPRSPGTHNGCEADRLANRIRRQLNGPDHKWILDYFEEYLFFTAMYNSHEAVSAMDHVLAFEPDVSASDGRRVMTNQVIVHANGDDSRPRMMVLAKNYIIPRFTPMDERSKLPLLDRYPQLLDILTHAVETGPSARLPDNWFVVPHTLQHLHDRGLIVQDNPMKMPWETDPYEAARVRAVSLSLMDPETGHYYGMSVNLSGYRP